MRRCRFQRSTASAMRKPPNRRNTTGLAKGAAAGVEVGDAEQRQKEKRQERGGEERDRFGRPPDRHPHTESRRRPARGGKTSRRWASSIAAKQAGPEQEADKLIRLVVRSSRSLLQAFPPRRAWTSPAGPCFKPPDFARVFVLWLARHCSKPTRAELASRAGAAAIAPGVTLAPLAAIAGVGVLDDEIDEASPPSFCASSQVSAFDSHISGVSMAKGISVPSLIASAKRAQGRVAAIRIAGIVRLAHAADERMQPAPIAERRGIGEEHEVSSRHEGARQARGQHLDLGT